ncbi:TIR domain-containing protein [Hymenobacter properus]|uniref:TIR domain-containing protein n=1 Tax=Hymenobacter properus TaxID=2791026 RepID=A0A931BEN2_9BACT|nr:hypothetical protein [Hymenobacter properus]MBF9140897.1 hypothetical protein [Hymenobacter properus]MBR7719706.1 hypothetical protein [Microvirga sp. SRT04]
MGALLPEYEHDIFISYRHNDNLKEGWVTDFVQRLQNELRATLKEPLNVYFDLDAHRGLGDSHDVDQSLVNRLKSLIFIPLISQTYCATDCYSWKSEFLPFKQQAQRDGLGLNLRLPGGNTASRILPVRINEIDSTDLKLLENELGGHLRSIDFVYQGLGINRPLLYNDDQTWSGNPGQLLYRNQINKVANAVKELVLAIKMKAGARASMPSAAPGQPVSAQKPTIFLPWVSPGLVARREELALVCRKAGFEVQPANDCPSDEAVFQQQTQAALAASTCAVHLLGSEFGQRFAENDDLSFPQYAYSLAKERLAQDAAFRQFTWYCPTEGVPVRLNQQQFINEILNELTERRTYSTVDTAMRFVEDLRSLLVPTAKETSLVDKDTDIFFVYNQQDVEEANIITDQLSEHMPCELLTIEPDSEDAYKSLAVAAIPRSRLAVVYFKYSADWALPFVKQVWRLVGGAASSTPILLLGEDDPIINKMRVFKAPRVISSVMAHGQIPAEVRRIFANLNR